MKFPIYSHDRDTNVGKIFKGIGQKKEIRILENIHFYVSYSEKTYFLY